METLGGELPEEICKMRDYLKFIREQNHVYPGKNVLFVYGPLGTGKTKAVEAIATKSGVIYKYYDLSALLFQKGPWLLYKIKKAYREAEQLSQAQNKPVIIIFDYVDHISEKDTTKLKPGKKAALVVVQTTNAKVINLL